MMIYFFLRQAVGDVPAGTTVSKHPILPEGDFRITEYDWGSTTLWFVDQDEFTECEREAARQHWEAEEQYQ